MFKLFKLANKKSKIIAAFALVFVALQGIFEGLQIASLASAVATLQETTIKENMFWIYSWAMLLSALLSLVCGALGTWFSVKSSTQLAEVVRHNIFYKASRLSFGEIDKLTIGSILTRMTSDVQNLQIAIQLSLALFIRTPVLVIFGTILSFLYNWVFGVMFIGIMILITVIMVVIIKSVSKESVIVQTEIDNSNKIVRENVLGIKTIKSYSLEESQINKFDRSNEKIMISNTKAWNNTGFIIPVVNSLVYAVVGGILLIAGKLFIDGKIGAEGTYMAANIFLIITLLLITLSSIISSGMAAVTAVKAKPSCKRIGEFIDFKPAVRNAYDSKRIDKRNLNIEFKDVNFKYDEESKTNVLSNISIKIDQGEMVGIVGQTGSGKTSLISLISRLYDIKKGQGKLTIGVTPIKRVNLKSLNREVGIVLQDDTLFSGTIRDNLLIGNPNASDKQLMQAARIACADRFIEARKDGLDAEVDQRGSNFSTGQQQRLSIARTLAKQPNILILDDATSSLDVLTEAKVQKNIRWHMRGGTTIITAQRVSTVQNCDHIIVMDQGKIVGYGTHDSLKLSNEMYRSLILSQMGEEGIR